MADDHRLDHPTTPALVVHTDGVLLGEQKKFTFSSVVSIIREKLFVKR